MTSNLEKPTIDREWDQPLPQQNILSGRQNISLYLSVVASLVAVEVSVTTRRAIDLALRPRTGDHDGRRTSTDCI